MNRMAMFSLPIVFVIERNNPGEERRQDTSSAHPQACNANTETCYLSWCACREHKRLFDVHVVSLSTWAHFFTPVFCRHSDTGRIYWHNCCTDRCPAWDIPMDNTCCHSLCGFYHAN